MYGSIRKFVYIKESLSLGKLPQYYLNIKKNIPKCHTFSVIKFLLCIICCTIAIAKMHNTINAPNADACKFQTSQTCRKKGDP